MDYFDYTKVAREADLGDAELHRLCEAIRPEFPRDDMMFELHVLRACMAIRDGRLSVEQALESPPAMAS